MFGFDDAALATAAVGGLGFIGQQLTNQGNIDEAAKNRDFQERLSNSAYQRQVADLSAAGLNPMLAYIKGGGASTPSGSQATLQSSVGAGVSAAQAAATTAQTHKTTTKIGAETENIDADTINKRAQNFLTQAQTKLAEVSADQGRSIISNLEVQSKKMLEEIKNIPLEGDRLIALAQNLLHQTNLLQSQNLTEQQRKNQISWLAVKTMKESDLLTADLEAIENAENFGKKFNQFKPAIDSLLSIIRMFRR